jgi:hypothetical protein
MPLMPRMKTVAILLAFALNLIGAAMLGSVMAPAWAQGVAAGGPIGNSTGIGSGLGSPLGTGPSYPNGTRAAPSPSPSVPPGGYNYSPPPQPTLNTVRPSSYPQPREPFGPATATASSPVLALPEAPTGDLSFLDGCWRSNLFKYAPAHQPGVTTYCFEGASGAGRILYRRLNQPEYFCSGPVQASYVGDRLRLHNTGTDCSGGDKSYPADLDCGRTGDGVAQCSGTSARPSEADGTWTVRLHRIATHHTE